MTDYYRVEPRRGFGRMFFGSPSKYPEYVRGFGDQQTNWVQCAPMQGYGLEEWGNITPEYGRGWGDPTTDYTEDNTQ